MTNLPISAEEIAELNATKVTPTRARIADIVIGERSRREMRNVKSLAASIHGRGILQPPVVREVDGQLHLVCGQRRLEAMKSLGWRDTPITVVTSVEDEIAALYAERDENTEREPFTVEEAVAHRKRIRDAEAEQAKGRQGTRTDLQPSANLAESDEPAHERTTRHRTSQATGFGHSTLDKAEKVYETAEDEAQPEPVRKVAKEAAENLSQHGAKVDREYKNVEKAVQEHASDSQAYQDAQWRKQLLKELGRLGDITEFDPERVVAICDEDQIQLISDVSARFSLWHGKILQLRQGGLRLVGGDE